MSNSETDVISLLKPVIFSFIVGVVIFLVGLPFYKSRKSWYDAIAARKIIAILRIIIVIEMSLCSMLLYFAISLGSPLPHPYSSYALPYGSNSSNSWVFGYGRPVFCLFSICVGLFGDMHTVPRIFCILSAVLEAFLDGLSAVFVKYYINQVNDFDAPLGNYTTTALTIYYYRELASFTICIWIILLCSHLATVVGWEHIPIISYPSIVGGQMDRGQIMRDILNSKKNDNQNKDKNKNKSKKNRGGSGEIDESKLELNPYDFLSKSSSSKKLQNKTVTIRDSPDIFVPSTKKGKLAKNAVNFQLVDDTEDPQKLLAHSERSLLIE